MRRYLYIIALFVLAVVSCTPDIGVGTPFVEGQEVTITASLANSTSDAKQMPGKQRVSGKDAGATIDLTWNAGDEILVSVGDKSAVFTLSSGENTSAGEFTGKMPADGTEYSVSYPVDYSDDVLTYQTYVENGFGNGLMKMSTRTNGTLANGFTLSADNALLGLQLRGDAVVNKIVVTNLQTQATYTLDCSKQEVSTEGGRLFYIVVPAGTWESGMKVDVYNAGGILIESKVKAGEIVFVAGQAMMMPELEMHDIVYKDIEVKGVVFRMILVEGGEFMMGADETEVNPKLAATPVHKVTLSDYYIGETVIIQPLWTAIMGTTIQDELEKGGGSKGLGEGDDYPMYAISWYDSRAFAEELSKVTGMTFRLPTEAEWEYAARGGKYSRGYKYAGSNTLDEVAWHTGNSTKNGKYVISPVKLKKPNELGLYDMTGNIWEWCQDRQYSYTSEAQTNPIYERTDDTQLVIQRGGSTWAWGTDSYCVYYRLPCVASAKQTRCGLRLVLECE